MDLLTTVISINSVFTPEIKNALFLPLAKSIGKNLEMVWEQTIGKEFYYWHDSKEINENIKHFEAKISEGINETANENLQNPRISIVKPAFDSVKYFLYEKEPEYREMFAKLIVASCDKSYNEILHPSFVEIINQLSPIDARLLDTIHFIPKVNGVSLCKNNINCSIIECDLIYKYGIECIAQSVSNLSRLGLIYIADYDLTLSLSNKMIPKEDGTVTFIYEDEMPSDNDSKYIKSLRIEGYKVLKSKCYFTKLGQDFIKTCLP